MAFDCQEIKELLTYLLTYLLESGEVNIASVWPSLGDLHRYSNRTIREQTALDFAHQNNDCSLQNRQQIYFINSTSITVLHLFNVSQSCLNEWWLNWFLGCRHNSNEFIYLFSCFSSVGWTMNISCVDEDECVWMLTRVAQIVTNAHRDL